MRGVGRAPASVRGAWSLKSRTIEVIVSSPSLLPVTFGWMKVVRHVLAHTEDVGERFADEARRIHYGDATERGIRGQATPDEREALRDEGIEVMPFPLPAALKEPLQ